MVACVFQKKNRNIDEERTEKQIISAIEQGVNYFDTAYIYPGSEVLQTVSPVETVKESVLNILILVKT